MLLRSTLIVGLMVLIIVGIDLPLGFIIGKGEGLSIIGSLLSRSPNDEIVYLFYLIIPLLFLCTGVYALWRPRKLDKVLGGLNILFSLLPLGEWVLVSILFRGLGSMIWLSFECASYKKENLTCAMLSQNCSRMAPDNLYAYVTRQQKMLSFCYSVNRASSFFVVLFLMPEGFYFTSVARSTF